MERLIDSKYPYLFAFNPLNVKYVNINTRFIEDRSVASPILFNLDIKIKKTISVAIINGKYYLDSRGINYVNDLATIKATDVIRAKVSTYASAHYMESEFRDMFGVSPDRYEEIFSEIMSGSPDRAIPTSESLLRVLDYPGRSEGKKPSYEMDEAVLKAIMSQPEVFIREYIANYNADSFPKIPLLIGHCLTGDTKIRLLDGTTPTLEELATKYKPDEEFWVYSCKTDGEVIPAPAMFSRITKTVDKLAHVLLDNGEVVKCTVDHPFLTRDGNYVQAQDLVEGQSLMPLYYKETGEGWMSAYPRIVDNKSGNEVLVHRLVIDKVLGGYRGDLNIVHHKNFDKHNNDPRNLELMSKLDHDNLHSEKWSDPEYRAMMQPFQSENGKAIMEKIWRSPEYEETRRKISEHASKLCIEMNTTNWADPEYRKALSNKIALVWADPNSDLRKALTNTASERVSARNKTCWEDKDYREYMENKIRSVDRSYLRTPEVTETIKRNKILSVVKRIIDSGRELTKELYESTRDTHGTLRYDEAIEYFGGYSNLLSQASTYNHKVLSVSIVDSPCTPVYDITVPEHHNFALESGVFVHNTGIGKSALIESIAANMDDPSGYGYRVVNIKAGFIDKNDILGFVSEAEIDVNGKLVKLAQDSPMETLLTSTDAFVNSCREFLSQLSYSGDNYNDLSAEDKKVYDKVAYYAKTPIMFFDEINRSDKTILGTLMILFNQKRIMSYEFKNAPMLAAANWAIDLSDSALEDMYIAEMISDPATIDRFAVLRVSHLDDTVLSATVNYLSKKYDQFPWIEELLSSAAREGYFYNPDISDFQGKFPTFRGWDYVLQYISTKIDPDDPDDPTALKDISKTVIAGLIGTDAADFLSTGDGFKIISQYSFGNPFREETDANADKFQEILDETYNAGIPTLLLGRFGIAKTARVIQTIKKNGAVPYFIDLSAQDRTTIRGFPKKDTLANKVLGSSSSSALADQFRAVLDKNPAVPRNTTSYIPFDFKVTVEKCLQENKVLYVFFDEINRCSPIIQSAVFDAISEKKLLGVDISELFKRGLIKIAAAGNVGDAYEAEPLDSATMARFCSFRKDTIDQSDIESFCKWASDNLSPVVATALVNSKDDIIDFLNSQTMDDLNISDTLASFRSFHSLDTVLSNMKGFLLSFDITKFIDNPQAIIDSVINDKYMGHSIKGQSIPVAIEGQVYTYSGFLDYVKQHKDELLADVKSPLTQEVISTIMEADNILKEKYFDRDVKTVFDTSSNAASNILGMITSNILNIYNKRKYITDGEIVTEILNQIKADSMPINKIANIIIMLLVDILKDDKGVITLSTLSSRVDNIFDLLGTYYPVLSKFKKAVVKEIAKISKDSDEFSIEDDIGMLTPVGGAILDDEYIIATQNNVGYVSSIGCLDTILVSQSAETNLSHKKLLLSSLIGDSIIKSFLVNVVPYNTRVSIIEGLPETTVCDLVFINIYDVRTLYVLTMNAQGILTKYYVDPRLVIDSISKTRNSTYNLMEVEVVFSDPNSGNTLTVTGFDLFTYDNARVEPEVIDINMGVGDVDSIISTFDLTAKKMANVSAGLRSDKSRGVIFPVTDLAIKDMRIIKILVDKIIY